MEWAYLATAPDQITAEMWVSMLTDAGIAAMIRPSDAVSFLGVAGFGCRVQVRRHDLDHARELLGLDEETP
jgi:putative signal transducing protein